MPNDRVILNILNLEDSSISLLEANIFEEFALFWIIGGVWFLASMKQRRDDSKKQQHKEWVQNQVKGKLNQIHGTNKLDKYHWGGEYELLSNEESGHKYEFSGQPPIWIGDIIQLVWYFDKPGGGSERTGSYHTYYLVTAFEEFSIKATAENYPIRKLRYERGKSKPIKSKIKEGVSVYLKSQYKDGTLRKHRVQYLGSQYNKKAKLFYYFKYSTGTKLRYKPNKLNKFVVDRVIELRKLTNDQKAYGHFEYDEPGGLWLDWRELYLHLIEVRGVKMCNYGKIYQRVLKDRKKLSST